MLAAELATTAGKALEVEAPISADAAAGIIRSSGEPTREQVLAVLRAQKGMGGPITWWFNTISPRSCIGEVGDTPFSRKDAWWMSLLARGLVDTVPIPKEAPDAPTPMFACQIRPTPAGIAALERMGFRRDAEKERASEFSYLGDQVWVGVLGQAGVAEVTEIARNDDLRSATYIRRQTINPLGREMAQYIKQMSPTGLQAEGSALFVRTDAGWRLTINDGGAWQAPKSGS